MNREQAKQRVRHVLQQAAGAAEVPRTPGTQLLALSELARRIGGDAPAVDELALHELKVFSQNGEDGVLAEVLRRSGAPGRFFVEFGAHYGWENNCVLLADVLGWSGLFIEAGEREYEALEAKYGFNPRVRTQRSMVTPENVEQLFAAAEVPDEPDVLSIDIDGGDYWVWHALERYRPRVLVIEYNGALPAGRRLVQPRDAEPWDRTSYFGASLDALVALGTSKGYRLVHCELTGSNAFFVREDVPGEYPDDPARRASNHWLRGERHPPDPHGRAFVDLDG